VTKSNILYVCMWMLTRRDKTCDGGVDPTLQISGDMMAVDLMLQIFGESLFSIS
jgi:hypothetical protein